MAVTADGFDAVAYLSTKGIRTSPAHGNEVVAHCWLCSDGDKKGKGKAYINTAEGFWQCKRCGESGGTYLLQKSFGDEPNSTVKSLPGSDPAARRLILQQAAELGAQMLTQRDDICLYLMNERGLTAETIIERQLGYVGGDWSLAKGLPDGHKVEDLASTGLVYRDGPRKGDDFFYDHILIPYQSLGSVVQVRGKRVGGKYMTGPGESVRLFNTDSLEGAEDVVLCYSSDTEVLTERGWVLFPDLQDADEVAQFDPTTSEVSFVRPNARQRFAYQGDMVNLRARWCDLLVTPDHRMYSRAQGRPGSSPTLQVHPASNLWDVGGRYFPVAGFKDGDLSVTPDQARLVVAWLGDGCWEERGYKIHWNLKKSRKLDRIKDLLSRLGVDYEERIRPSAPGWFQVYIDKRDVGFLWKETGDKTWSERALRWPLNARVAALTELAHWDGDSGAGVGVRYFTAKTTDADVVSRMAAISGWGCTVRIDQRASRPDQGNQYVLNLSPTSQRAVVNRASRVAYDGFVYCCTVQTGALIVRRHGKAIVSGNCEGEFDCLTMVQALALATEDRVRRFGVVGIPGAEALPENFVSYFATAKRVYIALDPDDTGRRAAIKIKELLGTKARIVEMPAELPKCDMTEYLLPIPAGADDLWRSIHPHAGHDWRDIMGLIGSAQGKRVFFIREAGLAHRHAMETLPGMKTGYSSLDGVLLPGLKPGQVTVILAKTGVGKQEAVSNLIETPTGTMKFGDLQVGDYVFGRDGRPTLVQGVFPQGEREIVRVTFSDGSHADVGWEHLWTVNFRQGAKRDWIGEETMTTRQILDQGLRFGNNDREWRFRIPMCQPVQYAEADLPVGPYTLGALIANGYLTGTGTALTTPDTAVADRCVGEGEDLYLIADTTNVCNRYSVRGVRAKIRRLGLDVLSGVKFIPELYLRASVSQRVALLQGLMDGDGSSRSKAERRAVHYHTTSQRLAEDVKCLVSSLGGTASTNVKPRAQRGKDYIEYKLNIMLPDEIEPFSTARKQRGITASNRHVPHRCIVGIQPVRFEDAVCIMVAAADSLYLTGQDFIVTHNTLLLCNMAYQMRHYKILFVTLEMSREEVYERLMRIYLFHHPLASTEQLEFGMQNIMICDENRLSQRDFEAVLEDFEIETGARPDLVFVDYLGYFARGQKGNNAYERTTEAIMQLKALAKSDDPSRRCHIVTPAQVNRGVQEGKPITLDDARDAGSVEETADFLLSIFSPDAALQNDGYAQPSGKLRIEVLKSRHGNKGRTFSLVFDQLTLAIVDDDSPASKRAMENNYLKHRGWTWDQLRKRDLAPVQQPMFGRGA